MIKCECRYRETEYLTSGCIALLVMKKKKVSGRKELLASVWYRGHTRAMCTCSGVCVEVALSIYSQLISQRRLDQYGLLCP